MNPNQNQQPPVDNQMAQQGQLSPDKVAASLAFTNHIHKTLIGANTAPPSPTDPKTPEPPQEAPVDQKTENIKGEMHGKLAEQELKMTEGFNSKIDELKSSMDEMKKEFDASSKEMDKAHKKELEDIQKSIKEVLNAK